jgi:hypothetical protein
MRTQLPFALLLATVFACSMHASPAQAQRVFVSATGSDGNPCTFASPCRSFQHAHDVAPAGGEIDVLDPAGYGALTITKSISIQGHGFSGITVASGGNGITVNGSSSVAVSLNGLLIDGGGVGSNGIIFNSGSVLTIQNCVIRSLTGQSINFVPSTGASSLSVSHTYAGNNGGYGILVKPSGSASATAVFDHVEAQYNGPNAYGIALDGSLTSGTVNGTATDTISSNNGGGFLLASPNIHSNLMVLRSVAANDHTGVQGDLSLVSAAFVSQTAIINYVLACNGFVETYADNTVVGSGDCVATATAGKE